VKTKVSVQDRQPAVASTSAPAASDALASPASTPELLPLLFPPSAPELPPESLPPELLPESPLDDEDVASVPPASLVSLLIEPPQLIEKPVAMATAASPQVAPLIDRR
jgi:hypothetical protein